MREAVSPAEFDLTPCGEANSRQKSGSKPRGESISLLRPSQNRAAGQLHFRKPSARARESALQNGCPAVPGREGGLSFEKGFLYFLGDGISQKRALERGGAGGYPAIRLAGASVLRGHFRLSSQSRQNALPCHSSSMVSQVQSAQPAGIVRAFSSASFSCSQGEHVSLPLRK